MPVAVEIVLIVIGIALLALALIGSGISRRLMTIPKMHRAPRLVLAILGVVLLAGGMWGVSIETEEQGPSLADLKAHIPDHVEAELDCKEAAESPKGAVSMVCGVENSVPKVAWYTMFPDVNSMQNYYIKQVDPATLEGQECKTMDDHKKGSYRTYQLPNHSVTVGDEACYVDGSTIVNVYTDRRHNIVVWAQISDARDFSEFRTWCDEISQPDGDSDATPATPTHTVAARH